MKIGRVKVVVVDANWGVVKMRTAFEYNALEVVKTYQREFPGFEYRIDTEGDYILYPPPVDAPAEPAPSSTSRRRSS